MLLTKINTRKKHIALATFILLFLATRIPFLGLDEINPDAVNWHYRSEQFIVGLKSKDFLKTYQHYHPGVTLMWIMGMPIEIARQVNPSLRVYNEGNFITQHTIAKASLVCIQLILTILIILGLKKIIGFKKALIATSIFSLEPFFLGNSRILHMDVLLALALVSSFIYAYKYTLTSSYKDLLLCGFFCGFSFLTKSVGALAGISVALFLVFTAFREKAFRKYIPKIGLFISFLVIVIIALFPALWVAPKYILEDIYNEGLRIGTRRGHDQILMGEYKDSAGLSYYPIVLALKTSPVIWVGVILCMALGISFTASLISSQRKTDWEKDNKGYRKPYLLERLIKSLSSTECRFLVFTGLIYLVYFLGMSVASKKIDRYMIPLYPFLGLVCSLIYTKILDLIYQVRKERNSSYIPTAIVIFFIFLIVTISYPIVTFYPYYFTYTNPFFGSSENANRIIGQKPFGLGIPMLKETLINKYGEDITIGFIDRKPMSMIFPNSKLFDIRVDGTKKFNIIVLGPNENMPENVLGSKNTFTQNSSMYINGLEFYRIFTKDQVNVKDSI